MIGSVLALLAGFSFAASNVFIRRGVYRSGESFSPTPVSAFLGTVVFVIPVLVLGEGKAILSLSWVAASSLAAAGVLHFLMGRYLAYTSFRLIGANRGTPIVTGYTLVGVLLGVFFLNEPVTIPLIIGLVLIIGGITLISTGGSSSALKQGTSTGSVIRGISSALGAALCWGASPALVKIGLREVGSPWLAIFISYFAASLVAGGLLLSPGNYRKVRRLNSASLVPIIMGALATSAAQILRYFALDFSLISVVTPILGTQALFVFPLSFLVNRKLETFNALIIIGAIAVVAGVFSIF